MRFYNLRIVIIRFTRSTVDREIPVGETSHKRCQQDSQRPVNRQHREIIFGPSV